MSEVPSKDKLCSRMSKSCGGSTELITIFNRVGAVASIDTLKRVILAVSQERKDQGIQSLLASGSFTVASVNNIDFLQAMLLSTPVVSIIVGTTQAFS